MTPKEFAEARAELGMSQAELAAALECDIRSVQKWEGGERRVMGPLRVVMRLLLENNRR